MLNLLPQNYKKELRREYLYRFFIMSAKLFSLVVISGAVMLFPLYLFTNLRYSIIENKLVNVKASTEAKDKNAVLAVIKDLEKKTAVISLVSGEEPTQYLQYLNAFKLPGISITTISYVKKDAKTKQISIGGVAKSRSDLTALWKKAKAVSWVTSSDMPLSDFVSDKNIDFTITFNATSSQL